MPSLIRYFFVWLALLALVACSGTSPTQSAKAMKWKIDHYKVPCVGEGIFLCYLLTREGGEREYFYDEIEGFDYEWGYTYEIEVVQSPVKQPMADASSFSYHLKQQLSKEKVSPETTFELPLVLDEQPLIESATDACTYLGGIPIDTGDVPCTELANSPSGIFRHGEGGGLVWVGEK
jgi:hypothetical protein